MSDAAVSERLDEFREALSLLKRDTAKVLAERQFGGDRKKRRELGRALEACKRRSKTVDRLLDGLLILDDEVLSSEERTELDQARRFLTQLQEFDAT